MARSQSFECDLINLPCRPSPGTKPGWTALRGVERGSAEGARACETTSTCDAIASAFYDQLLCLGSVFSASRELQPGGYCFHCFYCFFCFGQDIARLARNGKKSERIPLRALLSGNNNLTACICNLCDEWAKLAALQMQMATEGSPKITPLSRFSPFEL